MNRNFWCRANPTSLSDALWFVYMIYLWENVKDLKEALRDYERDLRDPLCFLLPSKKEIEGMEFIKRYLNE